MSGEIPKSIRELIEAMPAEAFEGIGGPDSGLLAIGRPLPPDGEPTVTLDYYDALFIGWMLGLFMHSQHAGVAFSVEGRFVGNAGFLAWRLRQELFGKIAKEKGWEI